MRGENPDREGKAREARRRRRERLPWWLLAGAVGLLGGGGWLASSSLSAQLARVEQLEREAAESEARVAELQVLRDSMARRLRVLEQQQAAQAGTRTRRLERGAGQARREAVRAELRKLLKAELQRGEAFLEEAEGRLRVELSDRLLFEPRKAVLTPGGAELLARVGARLGAVEEHLVRVAAHTDAVPEGPEGATSWELSSARAVVVVRHLGEAVKVAPERLVAAGHGAYHPAVPDDGPGARARNRRVELLLLPAPPSRPPPPPLPRKQKRNPLRASPPGSGTG